MPSSTAPEEASPLIRELLKQDYLVRSRRANRSLPTTSDK